VDVPVEKILRPVAIDQAAKTNEAPVAEIFPVVYVTGCCMTDHDIEVVLRAKPRPNVADDSPHLGFGVLKRSPIVPVRSFESQEGYPAERHDASVDVGATISNFGFQAQVVISSDVEQRRLKSFHEAA